VSARPLGDEWRRLLATCATQVGVDRPVQLLASRETEVPMTWGLQRPVVLLPASAVRWPLAQRRSVLLHELAHVRRRDAAALLVAHAACILHWFDPLVWLAARRLRDEAELACDDLVLLAGSRPSLYAGHLLEVARALRAALPSPALTLPMARRARLSTRIAAILDEARERGPARTPVLAATGVAALALVLPLAAATPRAAVREAPSRTPTLALASSPGPHARLAEAPRTSAEGGAALAAGASGGVSGGIDAGVVGGVDEGVAGGVRRGAPGCVAGGVRGGVAGGVTTGVSGALATSTSSSAPVTAASTRSPGAIARVAPCAAVASAAATPPAVADAVRAPEAKASSIGYAYSYDDDATAPPSPPAPPAPPAPATAPAAPAVPAVRAARGAAPAAPAAPAVPATPAVAAVPAPPAPPAPPAVPAPPAPPAASFESWARGCGPLSAHRSTSIDNDDNAWSVRARAGSCRLEIDIDGDVRLSADETTVEHVGDGGRLRLYELRDGREQELVLKAGPHGVPAITYHLDGEPHAFDEAGRRWLARLLPEIYRQTGIDAPRRVGSLLQHGGPDAVLAEVKLVASDGVRALYLRELLRQARLEPAQVDHVVAVAAAEIASDHDLAELLVDALRRLPVSTVVGRSFGAACAAIESDYDLRRVLSELLTRTADTAPVGQALACTQGIQSAYDRTEVLVALARRWPAGRPLPDAFFSLTSDIHSDYDRRRALAAVNARKPLEPADARRVIATAPAFHSDYDLAETLVGVARALPLDGELEAAYRQAAASVHSTYDRERALRAVEHGAAR
jgi:hypothetical protein